MFKSPCPKNQNALKSSCKEGGLWQCLKVLVHIQVQILWVVDESRPSSTPNNFSLHNINYRKLRFNEKYTNNSETKWI